MMQDDVISRISAIDVAALCDANKKLRVFAPEIRPVNTFKQMVGRAYTVRCRGDFLPVLQALHNAKKGDVLIIDAGGETRAVAGELFATEANRKKLCGIVIDGACRDISKLETISLPFYSRYICPMAGTTQQLAEKTNSCLCGGVTVYDGDWIIGDKDGIVAIDTKGLPDILTQAEAIQAAETKALQRMEKGESLFDMLSFDDHAESLKKGLPSKLQFKL